jgi:hypothetical protein
MQTEVNTTAVEAWVSCYEDQLEDLLEDQLEYLLEELLEDLLEDMLEDLLEHSLVFRVILNINIRSNSLPFEFEPTRGPHVNSPKLFEFAVGVFKRNSNKRRV